MEKNIGILVKLIVTYTNDWLETLVELFRNLAGAEGDKWMTELRSFLRKQQTWIPHVTIPDNVRVASSKPPSKHITWTVDVEGNIHFTVVSNGRTSEEWITYFENEKKDVKGKPYRVSDYGKSVLRNAPAPTNGVTYNIVVRPGKKIRDSDRITKKICAAADKKGWLKPHWEVACLIRDKFTDEQLEVMGLWYIITMHEPIKDSDGNPVLLDSDRLDGGRWLGVDCDGPDGRRSDRGGFAFAVSQVGPQT